MKKSSDKTLLFDFVPIDNYICLLPHVEIGNGNKKNYTYFGWISQRIEIISDEELLITIFNKYKN